MTPLENLPMQAPITVQQEINATVMRLRDSRIVTIVLYLIAVFEITLRPAVESKLVKRELTDEGILYNLGVTSIELAKKACGYGYERAVSGIASLRSREGNGHSVPGQDRESGAKRPGRTPHLE